ncbi:MAG: type II toxin-antitoxin system RelE/ParE family toxin [Candidatus Aminicenantes bacterium]
MYDIFVLPPAQRDLGKLEASDFARIIKKIRGPSREPRPVGCLKLTGEEGYRIRVGDHRVLYRIDDPSKRVYLYRIKHRKDAYS